MNCVFLNKSGSKTLILLFGGWSTDSSFYELKNLKSADVLAVTGYQDFDFDISLTKGYENIILIAWSFGVFAASRSLQGIEISKAVALNGTEVPIDNEKGIPEKIFNLTLENLSHESLWNFRKRMSGVSFNEIKNRFREPEIDRLRNELLAIEKEYKKSSKPGSNHSLNRNSIQWNRAYISKKDKIIPPANQEKFWTDHPDSPEIVKIDFPHYIDINLLINGVLPDIERVADNFNSSRLSYADEAVAQKEIAERLIGLIPEKNIGKILEIGAGSGFLTLKIAEFLKPQSVEFIDIYPLPPFGLFPEETYHNVDAEKWISENAMSNPRSFDAIMSSSSLQWFLNPKKFFKNSASLLKKDGSLLVSTFLPGNLDELKVINPFGIIYHSASQIKDYLKEDFEIVDFFEDEIELKFQSPREVLLHIARTGIKGNSRSGHSYGEIIQKLPPHLTYRPLYIYARKK